MNVISVERGFIPFEGKSGVSSTVFLREGRVYKISRRNSLERAMSDYRYLAEMLLHVGFPGKIQESEIYECAYEGDRSVCIEQEIINGVTIAKRGAQILDYLCSNPEELQFLIVLIELFLTRVSMKQLYPDIVGNPRNQSLFESINIILEPERGLVICDVGLSPHEDTLQKHGASFFDSENVAHYRTKMEEALRLLQAVQNE